MEFNEEALKSGSYLETIRALHQTVVPLRGALEQSRSEILELKTKSWPLENLESAITALSIENHLLRQKIVDLNKCNGVDGATERYVTFKDGDNLRERFKSVTSSLENISTTKSHNKSSLGERVKSRAQSFQELNKVSDFDPTFTSTPEHFLCKKEDESSRNDIQHEEGSSAPNVPDLETEKVVVENKVVEDRLNDVPPEATLTTNGEEIDTSLKNLGSANNTDKNSDIKKQKTKSRGKKVSVSINLDIYRKSSKKRLKFEKMENNENVAKNGTNTSEGSQEMNVLQHSSSTDLLDQEVDDIELIFTNEDTKETNLKEPLISIDGAHEGQNLQCPPEFDQNLSTEVSDRELEDDVFNDNFENENQENTNFQSQTFDFTRENSQIYNSKSDNSINQDELKSLKSYYSYQDSSFENKSLEKDESFDRFEERIRIVETDISKVGIQDVEYSGGRRNTCPNPIQYRPIVHREALGRGLNNRKSRPILAHSSAIRKESGAQTDISALPNKSSWRSESSLAHKVKIGDNFTTLPSKYPLPGSKLRLSEKTVEARRILLSDIGFTSMVPELSRSADHLCPPHMKTPSVTNYGQFLKTTDLYSPGYNSQRFIWTSVSPYESHSQSRYSSLYPLPSPPATSRRCSAPVSPCRKTVIKHIPSKVRFANGSLPELRGDWNTTVDSGDSTDSLVEEAEQYLRRSIDCIVSGKDPSYYSTTKGGLRRASAPEPAGDNIPPQGWQPFLPRLPRDLRLDYWVKVISPEGRVRGGRVRYIGHLLSQSEQFVGVQLSTPDGHSDGTYNNRRYFQCEPYHGMFVPFKKVIMGWKP